MKNRITSLLGIFVFSFTVCVAYGSDSLMSKILYDFENRPYCMSKETAIKLITHPDLPEDVLIKRNLRVQNLFFPFTGDLLSDYQLQEVSYSGGWKKGEVVSGTEISILSNRLKISAFVSFIFMFLMIQWLEFYPFLKIRNGKISNDRLVDKHISIQEKINSFKRSKRSKVIFLFKSPGFWIGLFASLTLWIGVLAYSIFVVSMWSMVFVIISVYVSMYWVYLSENILHKQVLGPLPPSDVD